MTRRFSAESGLARHRCRRWPPRAPSARSISVRRRSRSAAGPSRWKASRAPTACSNGSRRCAAHGRIAGKTRGVLVKCAKPGQELRLDLPTIGPATVDGAHAAGLAGIGVEARALAGSRLRRRDRTRPTALGLFVVGLPTGARVMSAARPLKIAIVAGEESGDLLGADIVARAAGGDRPRGRACRRRRPASAGARAEAAVRCRRNRADGLYRPCCAICRA